MSNNDKIIVLNQGLLHLLHSSKSYANTLEKRGEGKQDIISLALKEVDAWTSGYSDLNSWKKDFQKQMPFLEAYEIFLNNFENETIKKFCKTANSRDLVINADAIFHAVILLEDLGRYKEARVCHSLVRALRSAQVTSA